MKKKTALGAKGNTGADVNLILFQYHDHTVIKNIGLGTMCVCICGKCVCVGGGGGVLPPPVE